MRSQAGTHDTRPRDDFIGDTIIVVHAAHAARALLCFADACRGSRPVVRSARSALRTPGLRHAEAALAAQAG